MKKLIAEVISLSNSMLTPTFRCIDCDGIEHDEISLTLCDFIWELQGAPWITLEKLIQDVEAGTYVPEFPELADFSVNDKLFWARPPMARHQEVCISNENIPAYSMDEGTPQNFSIDQFRIALKFISEFSTHVQNNGLENLVGKKFEIIFA